MQPNLVWKPARMSKQLARQKAFAVQRAGHLACGANVICVRPLRLAMLATCCTMLVAPEPEAEPA